MLQYLTHHLCIDFKCSGKTYQIVDNAAKLFLFCVCFAFHGMLTQSQYSLMDSDEC